MPSDPAGTIAAAPTAEPDQARLRAILDCAIDYGIIELALDGTVTFWNEGAHRLLGWTAAEMLGQPAGLFFTDEDRAAGVPEAEMHAAIARGHGNDERWHQRRDGTRFWASGEMMPRRGQDGRLEGFVKILRDRTRQRELAEQQRADAEFLRGILAASGDCIKVLDLDGRLQFMTEAGKQVMEVSDFNAIRGCPWPALWDGAANLDAADAVATARAGGIGHFQGPANTIAGTPKWWDVQVTPIFGADGRPEKLLSVSRDITASRLAEEALREAQGLNTLILRSSLDCIVVLDLDGHTQFVSPGGIAAMEIADIGAILGLSWLRVWHGAEREAAAAAVAEARAGGTGRFQGFCPTHAGTPKWWDVVVSPLPGPDGAPDRLVSVGRDITARRRAEDALRESETRFRLIADSAPVPIWVTKLDRRRAFANRAYVDFLGVSYQEALDFDWRTIIHPDDQARVYAEQAAKEASLQPFTLVARYRHPDGSWRWVQSESQPRFGPDGRHTGFIGVAHDITATKQAEADMLALNATLEARVEARTLERDRAWKYAQDLQVVIGADGIVLAANEAWFTILGWRPEELIGTHHLTHTHPDCHLAGSVAMAQAQAGDMPPYEAELLHKDGSTRWISWVAAAAEGLVYGSGRNITAEREAAAALQAAQAQLRQAQKMEAVGQLTGGIAHDFNNLLTGISGSLELARTRVAQGRVNDLDRYIVAAQGAATRAAALTHRLLAFSRRQTLDPSPVDVDRLVAGMEDLIRRTLGPGITLEVVRSAGLWTVMADPNQLENALLNLCINGRDAMPDGGRLTIETRNTWLDARAARERELPPGPYLSLSVSDTGTGMTAETVRRAFDPFYTTKPIGMGTGLGLSMIYGFVRQSGGQARIYSEPSQGTTVCLYLPRHDGDADVPDEAPPRDAAPRARAGETVLVVDDEPTIRLLVAEVLQELGYLALEAQDGAAGLELLRSGARIDLLITDVGLPGDMNGRQLADAGRMSRAGLKVLFITGYAEAAIIGNGHLDPGMHIMTKPFGMDALAARIRALIAGA